MHEDLTSLTLTELAALHADRRAALADMSTEFDRIDAVCKLVAKRLARFPEERLSHAIAALRLKRDQVLPSALLPPGTEIIDRNGLLARARTLFGVGRTSSWLHVTLRDRRGPRPVACDNGVWFYARAEAEAWLDGLLSKLVDGRLPHDPVLRRRRMRERIKREEQYQRESAEREQRQRFGGISISFVDAYRNALECALQQAQPAPSAPPDNVIVFPSDGDDEPSGAA